MMISIDVITNIIIVSIKYMIMIMIALVIVTMTMTTMIAISLIVIRVIRMNVRKTKSNRKHYSPLVPPTILG